MNVRGTILLGAAFSSVVSGCAVQPGQGFSGQPDNGSANSQSVFSPDNPCSHFGATAGAIAGIVIGATVAKLSGAKTLGVVGGGAGGAILGGFIGNLIDNRRCALYKVAQENNLQLASASITSAKLAVAPAPGAKPDDVVGLDVQLQNDAKEFYPGTAQLTPQARLYVGEIGSQYSPKTILSGLPANATPQQRQAALQHKILIVGHTDENDATSSESLAELSQQRARAIAQVFAQEGVPAQDIFYQGAGDTLPVANNATEQGRIQNQRTQIVDVQSDADLQQYLRLRSTDPSNYSTVGQQTSVAPSGSVDTAPRAHDASQAITASHRNTTINGRAAALPVGKPKPSSSIAKNPSSSSSSALSSDSDGAKTTDDAVLSMAKPARGAIASSASSPIDFGGAPITTKTAAIYLGAPVTHSMFSLISTANASTPVVLGACTDDRPHVASEIQNLATGQKLNVRDYLPGFFGAPWLGGLNGNLVAVLDARVPSDAGSPVPNPRLSIYQNYKGDAKQKPAFSETVRVNVYRGSDATLYRMFANGPMQCMDLVVPTSARQANGTIYYLSHSVLYNAPGKFALN